MVFSLLLAIKKTLGIIDLFRLNGNLQRLQWVLIFSDIAASDLYLLLVIIIFFDLEPSDTWVNGLIV